MLTQKLLRKLLNRKMSPPFQLKLFCVFLFVGMSNPGFDSLPWILNISFLYAVEDRIPRVYPWMNEPFQILSQGYTT